MYSPDNVALRQDFLHANLPQKAGSAGLLERELVDGGGMWSVSDGDHLPPPPGSCKEVHCFQRDPDSAALQVFNSIGDSRRNVAAKGLRALAKRPADIERPDESIVRYRAELICKTKEGL